MLQLTIPSTEMWDEVNERFIKTKEQTLCLEHSLVSLSKWESKWHKSFLSSKEEKTVEETIDYIKCMTLTQNVDPEVYNRLSQENFNEINEYIENPMTATKIYEDKGVRPNRETITSELIYYWMIALNIPMECQKWHLNKLLMLIRVCNLKNKPPKKMSKRQLMSRNASLNAARRQQMHTSG